MTKHYLVNYTFPNSLPWAVGGGGAGAQRSKGGRGER